MERTCTFQAYNGREVVMDIIASNQIAFEKETCGSLSSVEPSETSLKVLMTNHDVRSESNSIPNIQASRDNVEEMSITSIVFLPDDVLSNSSKDSRDPITPQSLFKVRDVVDVESRVRPGINKPGGIARVIHVHCLPVGGDITKLFCRRG